MQDYWATEPDARAVSEAPAAAAEAFAGWQRSAGPSAGSVQYRRGDGLLAATVKAGSAADRGWVTVSVSTPCISGPEPQAHSF